MVTVIRGALALFAGGGVGEADDAVLVSESIGSISDGLPQMSNAVRLEIKPTMCFLWLEQCWKGYKPPTRSKIGVCHGLVNMLATPVSVAHWLNSYWMITATSHTNNNTRWARSKY